MATNDIMEKSVIAEQMNIFRFVDNLPFGTVRAALSRMLMFGDDERICNILNEEMDGLGTAFIKAKGEK